MTMRRDMMSLTIGELGGGGWRHSCRQLLLRASKKKHGYAPASLARERTACRAVAACSGCANERRDGMSTRALRSTIVSRAKEVGWASNLGRVIPWLYIHRDVMSARQYCRRVNAGMLAGACRCADGMCLMCWRCVGSRTSEGAPPQSPRSRTPHHPIALRAKA